MLLPGGSRVVCLAQVMCICGGGGCTQDRNQAERVSCGTNFFEPVFFCVGQAGEDPSVKSWRKKFDLLSSHGVLRPSIFFLLS